MSVELRYITEDEFPDYVRTMFWAAGRTVDDALIRERRLCTDIKGALAVFDGKRVVGTLGMRDLRLQVPGGRQINAVAIGQGGVLPGHTAEGHSRRMATHLMKEAVERGFAVAAGTMSEGAGFGRFGWGPATYTTSYGIDPRRTRFLGGIVSSETCELVDFEAALQLMPTVHASAAARETTLVPRDAKYWTMMMGRLERGESLDFLDTKKYAAPFYLVSRNEAGEATGLAIYRIASTWERGLSQTSLELQHFVSTTIDSRKSIWKFLISLAHIERIHFPHGPVDELLSWLLVDRRRLENLGTVDHVWLRILDVKRAFEARSSGHLSEPVRVGVADRQFGTNQVYEFAPSDGRLVVSSTELKADVEMDIGVLGSLYLGGTSPEILAHADRIRCRNQDSLRRFASLFVGGPKPFIDTEF